MTDQEIARQLAKMITKSQLELISEILEEKSYQYILEMLLTIKKKMTAK